jgi:hypothetical protein
MSEDKSLDDALLRLKEQYNAGHLTEQEYDSARRYQFNEWNPEFSVRKAETLAPVTQTVVIQSHADKRRAEEQRVRDAMKGHVIRSYIPSEKKPDVQVSLSIEVVDSKGNAIKRLKSADEIAAEQKELARKAPPTPVIPSIQSPEQLPFGAKVIGNIIRLAPSNGKPPPKLDPRADGGADIIAPPSIKEQEDAIRARWKSGQITLEAARAEIAAIKAAAMKAQATMMLCPTCQNGGPDAKGLNAQGIFDGKSPTDKRYCHTCNKKGFIGVDTNSPFERCALGASAVDTRPEAANAVTYTAYLLTGNTTTLHSDSGDKAIKSAVAALMSSGSSFNKVVLDTGVCLVLHQDDRESGSPVFTRIFFENADEADAAGLAAMTPDCGECDKCVKAKDPSNNLKDGCGGYHKRMRMLCPQCKGRKVGCDKCKERGSLSMTVVYRIPDRASFIVSPEISRAQLLSEAMMPPRDQRVPSRKNPVCQRPSPKHDTASARGGIPMRKSKYGDRNASVSRG